MHSFDFINFIRFYFIYNIGTCYLNEAQVVTESSR